MLRTYILSGLRSMNKMKTGATEMEFQERIVKVLMIARDVPV